MRIWNTPATGMILIATALYTVAHGALAWTLSRGALAATFAIVGVRIVAMWYAGGISQSNSRSPTTHHNAPRPKRAPLIALLLCWGTLIAQAALLQAILQWTGTPHASDWIAAYRWLPRHTLLGLAAVAIFAIDEELFFRRVIKKAVDSFGGSRAVFVLLSAFLFALYHIHLGTAGVIHIAAAGIWLALFYARHRDIAATIAVHALYNATAWGLSSIP